MGNLITVAAGFLLASKGKVDLPLFFATLIGLALIIASACVFNNYINRQDDKRMERTKNRPLVTGLVAGYNAIIFAICLGLAGHFILFVYTNLLTVLVASIGFFVYVILYSFWKCRTIYGTAIGSIAGATPPVIGYCAVSNQLDLGAVLLFMLMVFWQMPHFFAIAIYHFDDYVTANMPLLPIKKGMLRTKIHMLLYILGFIFTASLLTVFNYTGYMYLLVILALGLLWLGLSIRGFKSQHDQVWGQKMFHFSLIMIMAFCFILPFDIV